MTFGAAIKYCLSHPFTFSGRARRSEFWWFFLFLQIVGMVLGFIVMIDLGSWPCCRSSNRVDPVTGQPSHDDAVRAGVISIAIFGIYFLVAVLLEIPLLAANARRLHDIDHSAHWLWFYLFGLGIVPVLMGDLRRARSGPTSTAPTPRLSSARCGPAARPVPSTPSLSRARPRARP